jgi:hypothetical protein
MYLACRPREKIHLGHFTSTKCISFPYIIQTYLFPSLLLVQVHMISSAEKAPETFGEESSIGIIDFTNLILRSLNTH